MKKKLLFGFLTVIVVAAFIFVLFAGEGGESGKGTIFKFNNGTEPETLDTAVMSGHPEMTLAYQLFEGLVSYDPKTNIVPGVAEKWDISSDGLTYTFHLRKNATWTDGQPVTAEDFRYAWLRAMRNETGGDYAFLFWMVIKNAQEYADGKVTADQVGVKVVDPYTFQVTLFTAAPYVMDFFAFPTFMPVPKHIVEKYGNDTWFMAENIVSNGPFMMNEWTPQQKIVLEKNKNYWDAKSVKLDAIVAYAIEEASAALENYLNGELDYITTVPTERIDEMKTRDDYYQTPQLATYYYILNVKANKALGDVRVRKALSMAVNRDYIVNYITKSGQIPAYSLVPDGIPGYKGPKFEKGDIATAKKLLADAGYPNGQGFPKITILYNTSETHKAIAEAIQQMWKKDLGIDCEIINQEWKVYLDTREQHDFTVARAGWIGDYVDPNTFLDMWVTGGSFNDGQWSNAKFDSLIKQAQTEFNMKKRMQILYEAEKILCDEMPIIPFYFYSNVYMLKSYIKGLEPNLRDLHPMKYVTINK